MYISGYILYNQGPLYNNNLHVLIMHWLTRDIENEVTSFSMTREPNYKYIYIYIYKFLRIPASVWILGMCRLVIFISLHY